MAIPAVIASGEYGSGHDEEEGYGAEDTVAADEVMVAGEVLEAVAHA